MSEEKKYEYDYNTNFAPLAMLKSEFPPLGQIAGGEWLLEVLFKLARLFINDLINQHQSLKENNNLIKELKIHALDELESLAVKALHNALHNKESKHNSHILDFLDFLEKIIERIIERVSKHRDEVPDKSQDYLFQAYPLFKKIMIMRKIRNENLVAQDVQQFAELLIEFAELLINGKAASSNGKRPETLEEYKKLFHIVPLPKISKNFQEDLQFANMRVAGPNPLVIQRMTKKDLRPKRFPVTNVQYQAVMGEADSIEKALDDHRLYLADYKVFEDALQGTYPQEQKYVCAPLAMFAVPEKGHKNYPYLCPIAIQCFQKPGEDNPIFTPKDENWLIAKTIVQIADSNFHEAISHLGRTHLFIEPFVLATHRKLPEDHPLRKLLMPHFQGTLLINWGANDLLTADKGQVNELLAPTIGASRVVATKGAQSYLFNFNGSMLKKTLKARHVDNVEKLPYYPYRDDAIKIWDAIQDWVKGYLQEEYKDDSSVQNDAALQCWAKELLSHEGGRLKNFGNKKGEISTLNYLIEATTMIIFTASAQHAAVNFPQSKIMSYAPAMPLAAYSPAPITTEGSGSDRDLIEFLPTLDTALSQLKLTYLLGSVYYTKLGKYGSDFEEGLNKDHKEGLSRKQKALRHFQNQLKTIEKEIKERNHKNRGFAYEYLMPSKIPQSINI